MAFIWCLILMAVACSASPRIPFRAAVYEHLRLGDYTNLSMRAKIRLNLDAYGNAAREAKNKGAQIILFPEYGLCTYEKREDVKDYLEETPDPREVDTNPCEEPEEYATRPTLYALSCMARDNELVVVANTGDKRNCTGEPDCPKEGVYHFNANVAFDKNGKLIGRYHKEYLFYEVAMDLDPLPQDPVIRTDFGTFATFICFDSYYPKMSEYARNPEIDAILFSAMWLDHVPLMFSLQYVHSLSVGNNATILVSNIHKPGYGAVGSGILDGRAGPIKYTFNPDGHSKLVVADVPAVPGGDTGSATVISDSGNYDIPEEAANVPKECSFDVLGVATNVDTDYRCNSRYMGNHTLVKLQNPRDTLEACNNGLCCSLTYAADVDTLEEQFYLAAFSGDHPLHRYWHCFETCFIIRCENTSGVCTTFPMQSKTGFNFIFLKANFTTPYVFPSVMYSGAEIAPPSAWQQIETSSLVFKSASAKPVFSAGLNARCFDRDPPYIR